MTHNEENRRAAASVEIEDKESLERELNLKFPGFGIELSFADGFYIAKKTKGAPWFVTLRKDQWDALGEGLYRFGQFAAGFGDFKEPPR